MATDSVSGEVLVGAILDFLVGQDLLTLGDIRLALQREIQRAGPDALVTLKTRLTEDHGWDYYPPDPLARRIHHMLAESFLKYESEVRGIEHALALGSEPVTIFSNHLSYADANVIEVLLHRAGASVLATRLTALAGPKVFTSPQRRFSSLCFGTIKVPQSADVSSEEAVLNPRDVARAARQAIDVAMSRLGAGDALLLFAEGTRSRAAAMQPLLAAVARYLHLQGTLILPVGLTGSEDLFAIGDPTLRVARATLHLGRPIPADALRAHTHGDRRLLMDAIGLAVAELLPLSYQGVYGEPGAFPEARAALHAARP